MENEAYVVKNLKDICKAIEENQDKIIYVSDSLINKLWNEFEVTINSKTRNIILLGRYDNRDIELEIEGYNVKDHKDCAIVVYRNNKLELDLNKRKDAEQILLTDDHMKACLRAEYERTEA